MNRRNLLKALGLGGVGLVTGLPNLSPAEMIRSEDTRLGRESTQGSDLSPAEMIEVEDKRLGRPPSLPTVGGLDLGPPPKPPCHDPYWEHPHMDRIELALNTCGRYPEHWGRFHVDVSVIPGDMLKVNYTVSNEGPPDLRWPDDLVLYRVYDMVAPITVIGTCIEGPIVKDESSPNGHRLATLDDMIPNEEESRKHYL